MSRRGRPIHAADRRYLGADDDLDVWRENRVDKAGDVVTVGDLPEVQTSRGTRDEAVTLPADAIKVAVSARITMRRT